MACAESVTAVATTVINVGFDSSASSTHGPRCHCRAFGGNTNSPTGSKSLSLPRSIDRQKWRVLLSRPDSTKHDATEKSAIGTDKVPSTQSHLDLLEELTAKRNEGGRNVKTIAQQLVGEVDEEVDEVSVPLVSGEKPRLTISQKRNIRRQTYLNEVSKRNDAPFFATVLLFVIVPPAAILGVAVATGYIDLFP